MICSRDLLSYSNNPIDRSARSYCFSLVEDKMGGSAGHRKSEVNQLVYQVAGIAADRVAEYSEEEPVSYKVQEAGVQKPVPEHSLEVPTL